MHKYARSPGMGPFLRFHLCNFDKRSFTGYHY